MNTTKHIILLLFSAMCLQLNGQSNNMMGDAAEQNLRSLGSAGSSDQIRTFNNSYRGVVGTPFLVNRWQKAVLVTAKKDTIRTSIKLDLFKDDLWAILSKGDSIIVDKGLVRSFSFHDEQEKRDRDFFFDSHLLGYFEMAYKGNNISLASKRRKDLIKAAVSGGYRTGNPYDEFVTARTQYFVIKDGKLHQLRQRRGVLEELLGKDAASKAADVDFKDEEQVLKLVREADGAR